MPRNVRTFFMDADSHDALMKAADKGTNTGVLIYTKQRGEDDRELILVEITQACD